MIKKLTIVSILSLTSLNAGFFDSIMSVVSSPEAQKTATSLVSNSGLIDSVAKDTNISTTQSAGAISNILQYSKSQMSSSDYSKVSDSVPGFSALATNGITSAITSSEALNSSLKTLGIDPSMVKVIIPVVVNYVQSQGGTEVGSIISNSLSSLLK